jgi:hypothetical protein
VDAAEFKLWVAKLPELDKNQLAELQSRFKLLGSLGQKEHVGKSDFGNRLLAAVCEVMRKNQVETPTVNMLQKTAAYANCRGKLDNLSEFLELVSKSKLVQDAVLKEGINLLYYDLVGWNVPVSSHTILKQIHRIPSVLNRHYPGYAQSGVLNKLTKEA